MAEKLFPKGTEIEDIMDFVKDNIEWDDEDCPEKTEKKVWIKILRE